MNKKTILIFIIIIAVIFIGITAYILISTFDSSSKIYDSSQNSTDEAINQISSQETQLFNMQFEKYKGTNSVSYTKNLLTTILANNASNNSHQVKVSFKNNTDIARIQASLKNNAKYKISFSYNNSGYINTVLIDEVE